MRFILAILFLSFATTSFAASTLTVCNDGTPSTNVRKGPSAKDYPKIGQVLNGEQVEVLRRITNSGGYDYYEIKFTAALANGRLFETTGYVYHEALSKTCGTTTDQAVAEIANTWPQTHKWWGCEYQFNDKRTSQLFSDMTTGFVGYPVTRTLCEVSKGNKIEVLKTLGYDPSVREETYLVRIKGCEYTYGVRPAEAGSKTGAHTRVKLKGTCGAKRKVVRRNGGIDLFAGYISNVARASAKMFNGGSSSSSGTYKPNYSYEIRCRDARLSGPDAKGTISLGQCNGFESECKDKFRRDLDISNSYWSICSKTFGSNEFSPDGIYTK